jgi:hypothetical protein
MELRSDTTLAVQFIENGGALRTILFVALPTEVNDLIEQETTRREGLFSNLYTQGPEYTSHNYGTITFSEDGRFTWTGYDLLVPQVIPAAALGNGAVSMRLFLAPVLADRYAGAFTLYFSGVSGSVPGVNFMYSLDSQGFRLEYVPDTSMDSVTVSRRASSPLVLYFFRVDPPLLASEPETGSDLYQDDYYMGDDDYDFYDDDYYYSENLSDDYSEDDFPTDF